MLDVENSKIVWNMGMGAAPSKTFVNTKQWCSELSMSSSCYGESSKNSFYFHKKVAHLESQLKVTRTALKNDMISKERGIVEEFASLFAPQPNVRSKYTLNFFCYSIFWID